MFKWLEKFLARPYEKAAEKAIIDKTEKPKDISEPVIAIVKTFSEPRRWKIQKKEFKPFEKDVSWGSYMVFTVEDTKTKEIYSFHSKTYQTYSPIELGVNYTLEGFWFPKTLHPWYLPSWMTEEEKDYVAKVANKIFEKYNQRILAVQDRNRSRQHALSEKMRQKERERLIKVYCNE